MEHERFRESASQPKRAGSGDKMIFIIKVTTNKEERAIDIIAERVEKKEFECFFSPETAWIKGLCSFRS